jgi:hypothetical protein
VVLCTVIRAYTDSLILLSQLDQLCLLRLFVLGRFGYNYTPSLVTYSYKHHG